MTRINRFIRQIKVNHRMKHRVKKQVICPIVSKTLSYEEIIKRYDELLI